jgi:hypothetical protein
MSGIRPLGICLPNSLHYIAGYKILKFLKKFNIIFFPSQKELF